MFQFADEEGQMPRTLEMKQVRALTSLESLKGLAAVDDLRGMLGRPGGLMDLVDQVLPTLSADERAWFGGIPSSQQEAIRAVVDHVLSTNDGITNDDLKTELEIEFTPAYDYGVNIFEFDRTVVIRVSGPYTGQPSPREIFSGS